MELLVSASSLPAGSWLELTVNGRGPFPFPVGRLSRRVDGAFLSGRSARVALVLRIGRGNAGDPSCLIRGVEVRKPRAKSGP